MPVSRSKPKNLYASKAWRGPNGLRTRRLLHANGMCENRFTDRCTKIATCVDHLRPVETHPHLALVFENLRASCWSCNNVTGIDKVAFHEARDRAERPTGPSRDWFGDGTPVRPIPPQAEHEPFLIL